jgi:hypothetical protein
MDRLDDRARDHLCKLLGMLGSTHDGERAAAGLKAHEFLKRCGLTWYDVIALPAPAPLQVPNWRKMVHACLAAQTLPNPKELNFVRTLMTWRGMPTDKQLAWLIRIYKNLS